MKYLALFMSMISFIQVGVKHENSKGALVGADTTQQKLNLQVSEMSPDKKKIIGFIQIIQPKYPMAKAKQIADVIFLASKRYRIDPYVITTTAYVESEFDMKSKPCIGIMQMLGSTIRSEYKGTKHDPRTVQGNIMLGTDYLKKILDMQKNKSNSPSRISADWRFYRLMWGRYSGYGSGSFYVKRNQTVLHSLKTLSLEKLKAKFKSKGHIW